MTTKTTRIEFRTDINNKQLIEKAAMITGQTLSSYILNKTLDSAKKDIEEIESLHLADKDRDVFYSLITNPPAPNENLKKLFKLEL
ncbi:MAG: DUF1778 domain-containing protein [Spirochaetaceae bacterium]